MTTYDIAVIPGDGIGKEVVPEGVRVLEAAGRRFGINFNWKEYDWSCERYHKLGRMMPEDGLEQLEKASAIFLGAVGFPGVPDHISLWQLLMPIRRDFQLYVNLRPVRLLPGVPSPCGINCQGISIFILCVKITRESTPKSEGDSTPEPNMKR